MSNPQSWNRYSYGLNNPVRFIDPTGHSVECGFGEQYCEAGKLNVQKRANDLYRHLRKEEGKGGSTLAWQGLSAQERSILSESYWDEESYNGDDKVEKADPLHDPLFYLESGVLGIGAFYAWSGGTPITVLILAQMGTQNRDGTTVSLGSYPQYKNIAQASNYTYFDLGRFYEPLNKLGLAEMANERFMINQMRAAKPFMLTIVGQQPGGGTTMEIGMLNSTNLYTALHVFTNEFANFFSYLEKNE